MALVSYARYLAITGDDASASASAVEALSDAQELLEDELGRIDLLEDTGSNVTERLKVYSDSVLGHVVFPSALPIVNAGDYTQAGAMLAAVSPDSAPFFGFGGAGDVYATVTYRGGLTAVTVPAYMARDIAWAAHAILHPARVPVPAGAVSVHVGDAGVTFAEAQAGGSTTVSWSKQTLRHRRRRL